MLQGGNSYGQSSIDNIQPEEPRYPIRDIRRRGCGADRNKILFKLHLEFSDWDSLSIFLSHAALVGFMAGAAILIGLQSLKGC
ncbi:high affinity sulfate transporter [Medicago truncatula]|uniref:High affinity sulfate transporter n=1 Tax=Medicago truncatula TaxID=3880 RepID=G7IHD8_MEDTR|nr:high affinity sulfate transporter [Medicago truncatula]